MQTNVLVGLSSSSSVILMPGSWYRVGVGVGVGVEFRIIQP